MATASAGRPQCTPSRPRDLEHEHIVTLLNMVHSSCFCMVIWQVRQKGVVRKPAHVHNYVHNAQMVVDALAGPILNMDLSHITGEAIVRGDTVAIR